MTSETILWSDTETKSECDLRSAGTAKYAEHPSTRIQLYSFAFNEDPVKIWSPEEREIIPVELEEAFEDPEVILQFHNAWFDRSVMLKTKRHLQALSRRKRDWDFRIERFRCSMAQALSHGLPGGLDPLGEVLGIREEAKKVRDGKRLVQKFCKPCGFERDGITYKWNTPENSPEDWAAYKVYAMGDTMAMREIVKKIPRYNYPGNATECKLWYMDQTVNGRGMAIDLELTNAAMEAINIAQTQLSIKTKEMTAGAVGSATQRDEMLKYIAEELGIELPNMQKATLNKLLDAEDTPPALRELLEVRLSTSTTSTAKYKRIVQATSADGRLRGTIRFSGAQRTQRDCLAEGTLVTVLTSTGGIEEKPIQFVDISDKVWDGIMWVAHGGVIYKGTKEVITHDGVCATPEHVVYLEDGISTHLINAKESGEHLWRGNEIITQCIK